MSDFAIDDILCLNKMMSQHSLNDKENEKHVTDRFIPIRKTSSLRVGGFQDESIKANKTRVKRG